MRVMHGDSSGGDLNWADWQLPTGDGFSVVLHARKSPSTPVHKLRRAARSRVRAASSAAPRLPVGPWPGCSGAATLDSPATPPGCDCSGYHRGFRHGRGTGSDGLGHDRGFRYRMADDTDSSYACSS